MKRTRHLLLTAALLVSTFSLTAGSITSVSELSNTKLYHVSQPNHSEGATAWAVQAGGSVLKSNNDLGIAPDNNDTCQQFAFLSNDGGVTRFLYHPTEEKFICRDGSLSTVPADPVYLKEGAYDNTFVAYFDDSHYINVGGSQQMVIDSWNTLDGGNSCAITAVGEFEPSAVIGSIPVTAQLDGIWYRLLLESRQASVVSNPDGATKYTGDISVSSAVTFDGLMCSVTSIGERAFSGCSNLTAITLPEGVTSIGVDAFSGCSGLTSIVVAEGNTVYDSREDCNAIIVTGINALVLGCSTTVIPEGVTSIGRYAFYGCDGLTSITLPESLESIGENAFEDCSGLTSINIPVSVTSIGRDAFYKCSSLVSVVIPVNVTCIEWGAFSCCNSLTSITIPESVTSIGNYAFFRCCGLASITIPESVTSIGDYAFSGCSGLASITIPESVTSIGSSAFCDCSGLTSITIPESVTSIGDDAFQNTAWYENQSEGVVYAGKVLYRYKGTMPENTSIEIKEGTKGIAGRAFYDCDGLASITIPESVTSIAGYAFYGCSLTEVQISSIEAWCNIDFGGSYANPLLFAENFCLDGEPIVELTIPNSVTAVKDYAFDGYDTLTSVTLPEGIMSIGASAFSRCSSLTSITCEAETPPTIGSSLTFSEVDKSISVYVPSSSVEAYRAAEYWNEFTNIQPMVAFGTCGDNLTWRLTDAGELIIEGTGTMNDYGTVTELSWNELLSSITKVTIEEGVTSIGSRAFQDCSNLTSIAIPASVTSIGGSAFSGCSSLTSIAIPESVMSIGGSAFYNCNLTDVHISSIESWCNIDFGGVYSNPIVHTENLYLNGELVTELTIPNSVTAIKDYAFDSYPSLTAITLPEGVTSIGKSAFSHCSSLASITIPESVTSVGVGAFDRCGRLTNVHISSIEAWCNIDFEGNFSNPIVHKENLYLNGNLVTELTIPNSVTAIKDYAFDSYPSLTSITLPESITSIGKAAFYYCRSLTSITIPEGVRSIGDKAFSYCNSLTSVVSLSAVAPEMGTDVFEDIASDATLTIPSGSTSSYEEAGWTSYFASVVEMAGGSDGNITWMLTPDGELIIRGTGAMSDYEDFTDVPWHEHRSSITKVTIKEGVTSIGNYAFRGCSNPTSITIPAGVTSVGVGAFLDCSSLTSITIPESVTSIGVWAFSDCIDLISIVVEEGNAIYDSREGCNAIIETSSNTLVSGCSTTIIPNTVTSIRSYAFKGCSNLASITIPEGVTSIGGGAFSGCSNLTSIILPEGVTSIGGSAFFGCSSLTSITIPEGVTSIGGSAFSGCSSLTSITIPESVTSIGVWAFSDCIDLISIVVEESNAIYDSREGCNAIIETSSNTLVSGCSTTIIPNTVTSIGFGAFDGCMRLTSINIPGSVTSIGSYAFKDCVCLTSINLPESVTSIGGNAFSACSSLTSITIPEGVTSIGDDAFRDCSSLTSITIPESVTSIGLWAFLGCSSLTSITIETLTPPTIETTTFGNVDRSIPVYVPASSVSAYQSAEYWSEFTNIQTIPEVITINQYGSATYCSEYALDFSEMEGLKAYAATGYNTKTGVVTLTRVMTSQPGMGLFLKGEPGEYIVPALENTDDNSINMLVGTVERTAINSTSDDGRYRNYRYTIKSGDQEPLFYVVEDGYTLGKGKAYLQIPVVWLPAETKAIGLRFDDGATTDIEDVGSTDNGEQATDIYDFMGRKVTNPQKGMMYIVNGKKTIMN